MVYKAAQNDTPGGTGRDAAPSALQSALSVSSGEQDGMTGGAGSGAAPSDPPSAPSAVGAASSSRSLCAELRALGSSVAEAAASQLDADVQ